MGDQQQRFEGYVWPAYTPVPDQLFDEQLPDLNLGELRVLLYIIRRTLGFRRQEEHISLSQMLNGVRAADGRVLDRGTGLSKPTLLAAIRSLEERGFIIVDRRRSAQKGDEPTTYRLNLREPSTSTGPSEHAQTTQDEPSEHQSIGTEQTSSQVKNHNSPVVNKFDHPLAKKFDHPLVKKSSHPINRNNRETVIERQIGETECVLDADASQTQNSFFDADASQKESAAAKSPSRARTRWNEHAHARDDDTPGQPFDLLAALCDELGADVTTLSSAERKKQLAAAKRLLAAGATPDDVRRETRWLLGQSWVDGVDLFLIEKQRAKWLLAGKPETARTPPAASRPPARSRDEEAREKIAAFLRIANGEEL
jgi:DNA-binding MarR family transcriptional regulator